MTKPTKYFSYTKGSDLRKGDKAQKGVSYSHSKIKEEAKSKWRMSDTGAVRTKITFPKSNKATVGKSGKLMSKKSKMRTSTGKASDVLV